MNNSYSLKNVCETFLPFPFIVYNMAPRSWKPDNSLIDAVPVDNMETEDAVDDRASSVMAYHAYRLGRSF